MDAGSTFVNIKCKHTFNFNLWQQSKWMYIQSVYPEEHTNTHKHLWNICNILVIALYTPDGLLRIFHILYFNPHKYLVRWAISLRFYRWENQGTEGEATFPNHRISNAWDWETNPGQILKANVSWVQAFLPSSKLKVAERWPGALIVKSWSLNLQHQESSKFTSDLHHSVAFVTTSLINQQTIRINNYIIVTSPWISIIKWWWK